MSDYCQKRLMSDFCQKRLMKDMEQPDILMRDFRYERLM